MSQAPNIQQSFLLSAQAVQHVFEKAGLPVDLYRLVEEETARATPHFASSIVRHGKYKELKLTVFELALKDPKYVFRYLAGSSGQEQMPYYHVEAKTMRNMFMKRPYEMLFMELLKKLDE